MVSRASLGMDFGDIQYPKELLNSEVVLLHQIEPGDNICIARHIEHDTNWRFIFGDVVSLTRRSVNLHVHKRFTNGKYNGVRNKSRVIKFNLYSDRIFAYRIKKVDHAGQAQRRKAYAHQRRMLYYARKAQSDSFSVLGITPKVSGDEFKAIKRKMMMQYHPDRKVQSTLSEAEFDKKSKQVTDAIAYVENYLKKLNKL